jgi:hypothetical protein
MKRNRNPFPSETPPPPHLIRAHRLFALGYFCCTDHSTIRALLRRRPCLEESLAKPGKHTGHKPFRIGITCSSSTAKDWLREPKPRSEHQTLPDRRRKENRAQKGEMDNPNHCDHRTSDPLIGPSGRCCRGGEKGTESKPDPFFPSA